jgi:hypothetical protein
MSTHVVNESHANPGAGTTSSPLLLELSPESRGRPGCEATSIRRNQDDPDNLIGDTRWTTRQQNDDYLAWRKPERIHSQLRSDAQQADADPLLRRDPIRPGASHTRPRLKFVPDRPHLDRSEPGTHDRAGGSP